MNARWGPRRRRDTRRHSCFGEDATILNWVSNQGSALYWRELFDDRLRLLDNFNIRKRRACTRACCNTKNCFYTVENYIEPSFILIETIKSKNVVSALPLNFMKYVKNKLIPDVGLLVIKYPVDT